MSLPVLPPDTGVMLCGHGSRNRRAAGEFAAMAEALGARLPGVPVAYGYLEFADPILRHGLDRLRDAGVRRILAVPGMLFAAGHAKNDIPSVLNTYAAQHPGLNIVYGRELGLDPRMLRAAADRVGEVLAAGPARPLAETLLLVVGRGTSDPDANANVARLTRLLWEGMGFGWAETAYSGVTFPLVAPALAHAARLGYRRIVVFPYFLFTGVLVKRIYAAAADLQASGPDIEIVCAPYLNDHPLVLDTVLERLREMLVGQNLMNCALCKYREQVLGFETEVGLAQQSHHHRVEGMGGGLDACPCAGDCDGSCRDEGFCRAHGLPFTPSHHNHHDHHDHHHRHHAPGRTSHDDSHHHSHHHHDHHGAHHPYPHADHPLGPVTLPRVEGRLARRERGE